MTRSSAGATTKEGFAQVVARLAAAQKARAPGAPAYSIYVNRPLGRLLAAAAYLAGLTPNAVTAISAVFTFSGIVIIALVPPSPLTGDELKAIVDNAHEDGLEHAAFGNRGSKFVDCPLIEMLARLQGIRPNSANFDCSYATWRGPAFCPGRANRLVDECAQSAP